MILPNNGKVVIIDDQPDDVVDLISALSKEKVPFVHYKEEDLSDLPDTPIENVRLIFLDLELITDTYSSAKNITSPIKTRLIRIIKPNTAYALVIWSKVESKYKEALLADFAGEFKEYKPIFHTSLPKADILGKTNAVEIIKKELEAEMANFKSLNAFLVWESLVNESSGKLTNKIANLYPPDADWDNKTKFLLYKLAVAYSGKAVNTFDEIKQLKNALYTLTLTFTDNIENLIDKAIDEKFKNLISKTPIAIENFNTNINRLLLISESSDDTSQPGNIYPPLIELEARTQNNEAEFVNRKKGVTRIIEAKQADALKGIEKSYNGEKQAIAEAIACVKKNTNDIVVSGLLESAYSVDAIKNAVLESIVPIEINITPLCDYAQEKVKLYRILPGAWIKSEHRQHLNSSPAYLYISDADFRIEGIDYLFLFDFRFLYSQDKKGIDARLVKYRLKQQLLSDIQVKLGSHINRSGVLYVDKH